MTNYRTFVTGREYEEDLKSVVRHIPQASMFDYGGRTLTIVVPTGNDDHIRSFLKEREMNYKSF